MNVNGDLAEIAFIHECYKRGFKAFIPYSHNCKTDVIIKRPGEQPVSVQIKKGTLQKNAPHLTQSWKALVGSAKSSNIRRTKSPRFTKYAPNAFDVLAIYIQEQDRWVLHKLADIVGRASIRWNAKHPSNNWEVIENYHIKS
jgi:hypothetical protein